MWENFSLYCMNKTIVLLLMAGRSSNKIYKNNIWNIHYFDFFLHFKEGFFLNIKIHSTVGYFRINSIYKQKTNWTWSVVSSLAQP